MKIIHAEWYNIFLGANLLHIGVTVMKKTSFFWKMKEIRKHLLVSATNQTLGVEDGVARVHRSLIFGGITNEALLSRESDVGWCRAVTLWIVIIGKR